MKHKIIYALIGSALILGSCSDFLSQQSQSEVIPRTTSDFSELLLGTGYPSKSSPNFGFISLLDDDCKLYFTYPWGGVIGASDAVTNYPVYSWQPDLADHNGYGVEINGSAHNTSYAQFYQHILGCNAVLDFIDDAIGTQADKDRVKAEALAVRALLYFQLVNLYGEPYNHNKEALGVPVKPNSNLTDDHIARSSVDYIYEEIVVKDLVEAARLMDPLPINRKDFRINQPAIHILLSRVYLYMDRYEDCISEAGKALAQGAVIQDLVNEPIRTPMTYDNPEVEWLFGAAVGYGSNWAYMAGTAPEFRALWDEVNDARWRAFGLADSGGSVYLTKPTSSASTFGQAIRTPEAYLNRMEAYALMGEDSPALRDLNYFCGKRYAGYTDVNLSGQALLDEIRLERRKELCFEGHRWFDLRRQGMPQIKHRYQYEESGAIYEFTLEQGDPMYTLPFPNSQMLANTALEQNPSRNIPQRTGDIIQ